MLDFEIPPFLQALFAWAPPWAFGLGMVAIILAIALGAFQLVVRTVKKRLSKRDAFTRSLILRARAPARLAMFVAALSWSAKVAPLTQRLESILLHVLLVCFMVLVGWIVMTAVDIGTAIYLRRHRTDTTDNLHARKMLTQTRILRRFANALVVVITTALVLMTIPGVKQLGVSLLAAGGAAGIILGLALQPVLSNLMAGIQIAFTQPIRLDDAVTINNEFGHVEEIKSTYVVIRLRDLRRLIVPLKFFLDQPFQNWTRESANLVPEVLFQVDQRVPMDRLRAVIEEGVRASPAWDGTTLTVQINDIREKTIEVRVLVGARNAPDATELKAEIRERVIGWLQREFPAALPRSGVEFAEPEPEPAPSAPGPGPGDQRIQ